MTSETALNSEPASELNSTFGNYMLHGIDEVMLPEAISWWPQTLAWKVLAFFLLMWACAFAYKKYRCWQNNGYRRTALKQLNQLSNESESQQNIIDRLPALLKATALQAYPRAEMAQLTGVNWLAMLDSKFGSPLFLTPIGEKLLIITYQPKAQWSLDDAQCQELFNLAKRWIKGHKTEALGVSHD